MARVQQWLTMKLKQKSQEHRKGKGKKGRNLMDELLIASYDFLWNVAHDDCMNRDKEDVADCLHRLLRNTVYYNAHVHVCD